MNQELRLLQKAKAGDRVAFGKLIQKHRQKVLSLAYDLVGNYEDAKDVAQDAFVRSFEKLSQFEERAKFSTWLYRITVNKAMDFHRRNKQHYLDSIADVDENEIKKTGSESRKLSPNFRAEINDLHNQIEKGLDRLSGNQKTATVLKYFHDKSTGEIAEILGCAEGTVRVHLMRASEKLKEYLKDLN